MIRALPHVGNGNFRSDFPNDYRRAEHPSQVCLARFAELMGPIFRYPVQS